MLAVGWLPCWAARMWMGTATGPCARGRHGDQAGCGVHATLAVYANDHRVCGCVTNCVTITTYAHGLSWILGDA